MKYLKNRELGWALLAQLTISAAAATVAFIRDVRFGILTLILSFGLVLIHLIVTARRYRRLADLSAEIDRILHGEEVLVLPEAYREGELGILGSEIRKMTIRLREQERRLEEDKRYLADLAADISHQVRTPLTAANLLVSLLSEPDLSEERRRALTRELLELLTRIDRLITSLLKLSRLDAGTVRFRKETIPIVDLLRESTAPLLVPIELREQTLTVQAVGNFTGDVVWTAEAIGNIVKNCMEHTPKGGTITISAEENALYTEIVISDDGEGIDAEDLPHLFERFYKGKGAGDKGFGIGLALARTIVTAQNGSVRVENRMPHGARFTLRFYQAIV